MEKCSEYTPNSIQKQGMSTQLSEHRAWLDLINTVLSNRNKKQNKQAPEKKKKPGMETNIYIYSYILYIVLENAETKIYAKYIRNTSV